MSEGESLSFSKEVEDGSWGCAYQEVAGGFDLSNIKICFVEVRDLSVFAERLSNWVLDTSWMMSLDKGVRRQYDYTVRETAEVLVGIFKDASGGGKIGDEFGELMVSIGSARGLEQIFSHVKVPVAELWKPQVKQNEGFDFHTVCTGGYVNFGEAKFSSNKNPHGPAMGQAHRFITEEKHLRDRGHLINLVRPESIECLDEDEFGVVAAFSINSVSPLDIFKNALDTALRFVKDKPVKNLYLVGVVEKC